MTNNTGKGKGQKSTTSLLPGGTDDQGVSQQDFFPTYNMGVSLTQQAQYDEALGYFKKAMVIISESKKKSESEIYKINLLINMAMIEEKKQNLPESLSYLN